MQELVMPSLFHLASRFHSLFNHTREADFLAPLLLRLFLAPVMSAAGWQTAGSFDSTVAWFANDDWGLGLPFPALLATLAITTELVGGIFLLIGLATRYVAVPLMITMLVAALSVHWQNGWFAVAPSNPETSMARPLAAMGIPAAQRSLENSAEVGQRLQAAKGLLREHGHYGWLTERGNFVVLNNGIEFAATYFVMLLVLFFYGAGRWFSIDYWIARRFHSFTAGK
jgi:putative oxidoreductase